MTTGGVIVLTFFSLIYLFFDQLFPRRYAIVNRTKISFRYSMDADSIAPENIGTLTKYPRTGTVIGAVAEYVVEEETRSPGIYLGNGKFPPKGYLVRLDDTGETVAVPLDSATIISGYGYAIKALNKRFGPFAKVCEHKPPLVGYVHDIVRLTKDNPNVERCIADIAFTPTGKAWYFVTMTKDEVRAENKWRKEEAEKINGWYSVVFYGASKGKFSAEELVLIRKGSKANSINTFKNFEFLE